VTSPVWHAEAAEDDLVGAAIHSGFAAELVAGSLDLAAVYDSRAARTIAEAVALPADPTCDLSGCDESPLLGRFLIVDGLAVTGSLLRRAVAVGAATGERPQRLLELVVRMPSWPTQDAISFSAREVMQAARRRRALTALHEMERQLLDDPDVVDAVLALIGAFA
jgi:hypothetical protein